MCKSVRQPPHRQSLHDTLLWVRFTGRVADVIAQRWAMAGFRLAMILNDIAANQL
jgi:hypothetical protein